MSDPMREIVDQLLPELKEKFERCERSSTGHVFKSLAEVGVICMCGHRANCRMCIRCGIPSEDDGLDALHRRAEVTG